MKPNDTAWKAVFDKYHIHRHDFDTAPFLLDSGKIKEATKHFTATSQREVRILCKQDTRESRPLVFQENGLFILPVKNGKYVIIKGEGYVDIPTIDETEERYDSKIDFQLVTSRVGSSEMQYLDFAYAASLIRTFAEDDSLVLTIRGRKYTPRFNFFVGNYDITVESVQTEVDAGYEGRNQVVLVEAKGGKSTNTIIRQLYYPFRQWMHHIKEAGLSKPVYTIFFEKRDNEYSLWQFKFNQEDNYNSIELVRSNKFRIINKNGLSQ